MARRDLRDPGKLGRSRPSVKLFSLNLHERPARWKVRRMNTNDSSRNAPVPRWRGIFCNRTLNLRSIRAIGYDMDYTLIHYHVEAWERRAFEFSRQKLVDVGMPLEDAVFDPRAVIRGLIIDKKHGNLVKTNRFGYIKQAAHGTRMLDFDDFKKVYSQTIVDLADSRWVFLNTLFALSEASLYIELVDRMDAGRIDPLIGYTGLYEKVKTALDGTHMEGKLKAEIIAYPDRYIDLDPEVPLTLLDQKHSGKRLALITNSEWGYTRSIMSYAFDRFLPNGMTWTSLFDVVIVGARKPEFFSGRQPVFEVVDRESGALMPLVGGLEAGHSYFGGHAELIEQLFKVPGEQILYIGDHVYTDVKLSKDIRRWRTALVLRELEEEIAALDDFHATQARLEALMAQKTELETQISSVRLAIQRRKQGYSPGADGRVQTAAASPVRDLDQEFNRLRLRAIELDEQITPLAKTAAEVQNQRWGLLMRSGNDKSHMARHVERHADVYTSRVSNFLYATPFVYLRSMRGSLPHDP